MLNCYRILSFEFGIFLKKINEKLNIDLQIFLLIVN